MKVTKMDLKNTQLIKKKKKPKEEPQRKNKGNILNKYHDRT